MFNAAKVSHSSLDIGGYDQISILKLINESRIMGSNHESIYA